MLPNRATVASNNIEHKHQPTVPLAQRFQHLQERSKLCRVSATLRTLITYYYSSQEGLFIKYKLILFATLDLCGSTVTIDKMHKCKLIMFFNQ